MGVPDGWSSTTGSGLQAGSFALVAGYAGGMATDEVVIPRQASIGGRFSRFYARSTAIFCWSFILFLPAMAVFGEIDWSWWQLALGQIGLTLLMLLVGGWMWSEAKAEKSDTERLQRVGLEAVAEVIGVDITDPGDGSADIARVELQIASDGVPPFQAIYRTDQEIKRYVVGARFKAVVDPSDNLFTLKPLPAPRP